MDFPIDGDPPWGVLFKKDPKGPQKDPQKDPPSIDRASNGKQEYHLGTPPKVLP